MSALPGSITFKVEGIAEIARALGAMQIEMSHLQQALANEAGRFLVNEAKRNVHVVSGRLRDSIALTTPTVGTVIVSANTRYARVENEREGNKRQTPKTFPPYGPHNYFTRAVEALETQYSSRIKVAFDNLWKKYKSH